MQYLSLDTIRLSLEELLKFHGDVLSHSRTGKLFEPQLRRLLQAMTESGEGALDDAVKEHQAVELGLWHRLQAVRIHPSGTKESQEAAGVVLKAFFPRRPIVGRTAAERGTEALTKKATLEDLHEVIEQVGEPELKGLFRRWSALGARIIRLYGVEARSGSLGRGELRRDVIATLVEMRRLLASEIRLDPSLPKDLDIQLFGVLDELSDRPGPRTRMEPDAPPPAAEEAPVLYEPIDEVTG